VHGDWATEGGFVRTNVKTKPVVHDTKGETNRPLNIYVPAAEAFHCPSDKGDSYWPAESKPNCYGAWGNSYLVMWAVDWFGVKHVTGDSTATKGSPEATPMKSSEIALRPSTKILQGDWPWMGSRDAGDGRINASAQAKSIWHNIRGKRGWNMMYGDGHVALFNFPNGYDASWTTRRWDINYDWW